MAEKTIPQLTELLSIESHNVFPVDTGTLTYKVSYETLKDSILKEVHILNGKINNIHVGGAVADTMSDNVVHLKARLSSSDLSAWTTSNTYIMKSAAALNKANVGGVYIVPENKYLVLTGLNVFNLKDLTIKNFISLGVVPSANSDGIVNSNEAAAMSWADMGLTETHNSFFGNAWNTEATILNRANATSDLINPVGELIFPAGYKIAIGVFADTDAPSGLPSDANIDFEMLGILKDVEA